MEIDQLKQKGLIEIKRIQENKKELENSLEILKKENEELKLENETLKSNQQVEAIQNRKTIIQIILDFLKWKK